MNQNTTLNDKALIEEILRPKHSQQAGIPAEKVKVFIANIGREIERTGGLSHEYVEQLLRQLKNGEL